MEAGLEVVKNYISIMKDHPTYFENCLPSQLDKVFAEQINTMTESRDEYGRRVYIFRPGRWNPRYVVMIQYLKSGGILGM